MTIFTLSLRIYGSSHNREEACRALGVQPNEVYRAGEPVPKKFSGPKLETWPNDVFVFNSPLDGSSAFSEHLSWVCRLIEQHDEFLADFVRKDGKVDIYCGVGSPTHINSFQLSAAQMLILGKMQVSVFLRVVADRAFDC